MTISNDLVLVLISGVGVILWWFVVTLIKDLKEQNNVNAKMLINLEKEFIELRVKLANYDEKFKEIGKRIVKLEDTTNV